MASRAKDLTAFLGEVRAERVYLVGDIVDLLELERGAAFPPGHRDVARQLLAMAGSGVDVVYVPGNHDADLRDLAGREICGVRIEREAEHETVRGERLLVTHGDDLDSLVRTGTNLEQFGAAAYRVLLDLDSRVNRMRHWFGGGHVPLGAAVKRRLAAANRYIRRFEEMAALYARERGFDGIVCGHIHKPSLRTIGGVLYANDGDWVEHRTALAEAGDGTLRLLSWRDERVEIHADARLAVAA